jgi:hypothetical protein
MGEQGRQMRHPTLRYSGASIGSLIGSAHRTSRGVYEQEQPVRINAGSPDSPPCP